MLVEAFCKGESYGVFSSDCGGYSAALVQDHSFRLLLVFKGESFQMLRSEFMFSFLSPDGVGDHLTALLFR